MRKNVLIYPSGSENAIEIYNSIKDSIHINVIPASGKFDVSSLIYENEVEELPYIQNIDFIDELNKLIKIKGINYIFPTHDTVALFFSKNINVINCEIITSNLYTNDICRHKRKTYEVFSGFNFCPTVYTKFNSKIVYPIFAKPNVGEGSKGVSIVTSAEDHHRLINSGSDLIFQEFLPFKEFTIDCFTDRHGNLLFVGPRERIEIKMGISFRSKEVKESEYKEFFEIAQEINGKLDFNGLWFFQLKKNKSNKLKLLEISTRASGTMGYFRHKGVNLPLLSLFNAFDWDIEINKSNLDVELYRTTNNKYNYAFNYNKVYLDFDDTLIINNKVNTTVIMFIYQCVNLNKDVYLLTKHEGNIEKTLSKYKISISLFKKIIVLKLNEKKLNFIEPENSIFIDNCYKERKEVSKIGIPVFDVDGVNSLMKG